MYHGAFFCRAYLYGNYYQQERMNQINHTKMITISFSNEYMFAVKHLNELINKNMNIKDTTRLFRFEFTFK